MPKYMVAYIDVESGEVEDVYSAEEVGGDVTAVPAIKPSDLAEVRTIPLLNRSIVSKFAKSSPGCRYIRVGSAWKRVCT